MRLALRTSLFALIAFGMCQLSSQSSVLAQDRGPSKDTAKVSKDAERTPKVGETATDFELTNLSDEKIALSKLQKDGPVVVAVLRGYPGYQCPACTRQVGDLIQHAEEFQSKKASVLLIYPGSVEDLAGKGKEFLKETELPENFHFVLDPGYKFTEQYGLRWDEPNETAYPSTFVIDREGKVLYVKISRTHRDRAEAKEVVAAIR